MKRLPDFLVIGAQKCGTTALIKNISMHPDVYVPYWVRYGEHRPEFHFFNENWNEGVQWYKSIFDSDERVCGEKSPEYLHMPECHERMAQVVPDCKLFVILRDPIERAFSAFNFARALHPESSWFGSADELYLTLPLHEAFDQLIEDHIETHNCFRFGFYADQLNHLAKYYPPSQVFVTTMEQLKANPDFVMTNVFGHIGIEPIKCDWVGNDYKATPYSHQMTEHARQTLRELYRECNAQLHQMFFT